MAWKDVGTCCPPPVTHPGQACLGPGKGYVWRWQAAALGRSPARVGEASDPTLPLGVVNLVASDGRVHGGPCTAG